MKTFAMTVAMLILLMAGFALMFTSLRGIVTSPSSLAMELVSFVAGLICLIAGLITGVYLFKPPYRR
jgi:uncharacterized membrane protein